jgi:hypothetical protein
MLKTGQKVRKIKMSGKENLASPIVFSGILEEKANTYPAGSCGSKPRTHASGRPPDAGLSLARFIPGLFVSNEKDWMRAAGFATAMAGCRSGPILSG